MTQDIRWIQRFTHFKNALHNLGEAVELCQQRELSKLEEQGLIKGFELVHELSWLTIKDYYQYQGEVYIQGSRDAFRLAFKRGLITEGQIFMNSIKSRQLSVHTYNEATAQKLKNEIINIYYPHCCLLAQSLEALIEHEV